jgi:hypothetical protein
VDDIHYTAANGADNFTHPLCIHTWRTVFSLERNRLPPLLISSASVAQFRKGTEHKRHNQAQKAQEI